MNPRDTHGELELLQFRIESIERAQQVESAESRAFREEMRAFVASTLEYQRNQEKRNAHFWAHDWPELQRSVRSQEKRISLLESFKWKAIGGLAVAVFCAGIVSGLVSFIAARTIPPAPVPALVAATP